MIQVLAERTSRVLTGRDTDAALVSLAMVAVEANLCDFATISHRDGGDVVTVAATDPLARGLDDEQYRLGQGPVVLAANTASTVYSDNVAADPRWPQWGPIAAERGVDEVLCSALPGAAGAQGSVNLYGSRRPNVDRSDAVLPAAVIAAQVTVALVASRQMAQLWKAVDARHHIGQAQGILMARHQLDADAAFRLMRGLSQHHNIPVRTIAGDIIDQRKLPTG
jgi:hypothetical protein